MEDWDKVHSAADHQRSAIPTVAEIAQIILQKRQRNSRENMSVLSSGVKAQTSHGEVLAGLEGLIMPHSSAL